MSEITISQPVTETEKRAGAIAATEEAVEDGREVERMSTPVPADLVMLPEENATLRIRRKNKGNGKKPNGQKSTTTGEFT